MVYRRDSAVSSGTCTGTCCRRIRHYSSDKKCWNPNEETADDRTVGFFRICLLNRFRLSQQPIGRTVGTEKTSLRGYTHSRKYKRVRDNEKHVLLSYLRMGKKRKINNHESRVVLARFQRWYDSRFCNVSNRWMPRNASESDFRSDICAHVSHGPE